MELQLKINLDNAAFDPDPTPELQRIFNDLSERISYAGYNKELVIRDINGNTVGFAEIFTDEQLKKGQKLSEI